MDLYPKHAYSVNNLKVSLSAANNRAERWLGRYRESQKQLKIALDRIEELEDKHGA